MPKEKKNEKKKKFRLFKRKEENTDYIEETSNENDVVKPVKRRRRKFKIIISVISVLLIVIILIVLFIIIRFNKNDGERIAVALSEKLGSTSAKAAENADIKLKEKSDYQFINELGDFSDIYESKETVVINGVNIPEWVIFCYSDKSGKLVKVVYHDYAILKNNVNGTKKNDKIDINKVQDGMTINEAEEIMDLKPIQIIRDNNDKKIYRYKYYYKDEKTKDEKSIFISIILNFDDKVMGINEEEDDSILSLLTID